jgi:hypothetical protein
MTVLTSCEEAQNPKFEARNPWPRPGEADDLLTSGIHVPTGTQIGIEDVARGRAETISNDPNSNDQNQSLLGSCFEHWSLGILNLFRASNFEFRICLAAEALHTISPITLL